MSRCSSHTASWRRRTPLQPRMILTWTTRSCTVAVLATALAVMMKSISSTGLFFPISTSKSALHGSVYGMHCIDHGFSRHDEEHIFHSYYQWVPLVLVLQAAFSYLPWWAICSAESCSCCLMFQPYVQVFLEEVGGWDDRQASGRTFVRSAYWNTCWWPGLLYLSFIKLVAMQRLGWFSWFVEGNIWSLSPEGIVNICNWVWGANTTVT